ncbi:hypothetical protein RJT34_21741 [Clitoria ternatea]|uniref:CRAL-TRIO domain-containing protein n=1 Tax=Clitoria ternatea TaxID=43366 RepID=A0AAN9IUX0_CLITE
MANHLCDEGSMHGNATQLDWELERKMSFKKLKAGAAEKSLSAEEQQVKIGDVKKIIGPIVEKFPALCSNASVLRYLRARNYNVKKAAKMLKGTIKWRLEYKPEKIQWEDVAQEAKIGRIYRADYLDKQGRMVFVIRPAVQSTSTSAEQIKYLVYCLENAIMNTSPTQEQMVWLIDFHGWSKSCMSLKVTRETAQILQAHYPERLGVAIFYNPPKVFESFWTMVKPFLELKTYKKAVFVYTDNPRSRMIMEEMFDMDKLESYFGGKNAVGFNYEAYAVKMKEDDKKIAQAFDSCCPSPSCFNSKFDESLLSGNNDSDDGTLSDEGVYSKFDNDDGITQGKMPCSPHQPNTA